MGEVREGSCKTPLNFIENGGVSAFLFLICTNGTSLRRGESMIRTYDTVL